MTKARALELAQFTAILCSQRKDEKPLVVADDAFNLFKLSDKLSRLFVAECNRELRMRELDAIIGLETKVRGIVSAYGLPVRFEKDPRGYSVRFTLPDGRSNNMGGEDWGI